MIERIFSLPRFSDSYYEQKILSHYKAYGTDYDFVEFYSMGDGGIISKFNSNVVISAENIGDIDELLFFLRTLSPDEIETSVPIEIDGYDKVRRTLFSFPEKALSEEIKFTDNPKLDDVFSILKTGFDIENSYAEWLTDTSHRIRHGVSKAYLYNKTTATMLFECDSFAFFGMIATSPVNRGKGEARKLLYQLRKTYKKECLLFAKDERVSFYEGAGFEKKYEDYIYIKRKDF